MAEDILHLWVSGSSSHINTGLHGMWLKILTASETSPALCIRADLMNWKKSTTPSVFSRSNWAWMQMNVPVRPIPSLHTKKSNIRTTYCIVAYLHMTIIGLFPEPIWTLLTLLISSMREEVMGGASCSGHAKKWNWVTVKAVFTPTTPGREDLSSFTSNFLMSQSPFFLPEEAWQLSAHNS